MDEKNKIKENIIFLFFNKGVTHAFSEEQF